MNRLRCLTWHPVGIACGRLEQLCRVYEALKRQVEEAQRDAKRTRRATTG